MRKAEHYKNLCEKTRTHLWLWQHWLFTSLSTSFPKTTQGYWEPSYTILLAIGKWWYQKHLKKGQREIYLLQKENKRRFCQICQFLLYKAILQLSTIESTDWHQLVKGFEQSVFCVHHWMQVLIIKIKTFCLPAINQHSTKK